MSGKDKIRVSIKFESRNSLESEQEKSTLNLAKEDQFEVTIESV